MATAYSFVIDGRMRFYEDPADEDHLPKLIFLVDNLDRQGFSLDEIATTIDISTQRARTCLNHVERVRHRLRDATLAKGFRSRDSAHRLRALRAGNPVENVDLWQVWLRDQGICHLCGVYVEPDDLDFDHVMPISRGGAHSAANVKVSHASCNRSKGARI